MADRDLFEELKSIVGCDYISDLRYAPWLDMARQEMIKMNLNAYPLFALKDAAEYLYAEKKSFSSYEDAIEFFEKKMCCGRQA